ncbi:unnamed protein product [Musa acuminata subsp. malaccensis]|uniref:(wild Malaysian banana) hypothetical protein n=1 Tax=Musa acuminata subsp. malaccensis TaxID=214687 RepID=A0A804IMP3_MUSAM|nr:PREDICTED: uncharacterized protein LOC103980981 [Musa acuminata subsp. malaccensis]CAG1841634.1 unnamed protein product [Musa acuminata subsp. malaccensis]
MKTCCFEGSFIIWYSSSRKMLLLNNWVPCGSPTLPLLRPSLSQANLIHRYRPPLPLKKRCGRGVLSCSLRHFARSMEGERRPTTAEEGEEGVPSMKLLFVEMGVGYDQHGQDITTAAMRACRDAISSNSIPAFRRGSIPGVNSDQMKLVIKLGVPRSTQHLLDIEMVKSVFPYGEIIKVEVVDGGMICSSGVYLEAMGDKNDDCYIVNAAIYVGY